MPDRGKGEDARAVADAGATGHRHVRQEFDPLAQFDLRADMAERPDLRRRAKPGSRLDDRRRMNYRHVTFTILSIHDHRGERRFGDGAAVHLGLAVELPHVPTVLAPLDMDVQRVAGHHRPAEAAIVDAHEVDELALGVGAERVLRVLH